MGGKTDADPFAVRTMTSCGEEIAFSDPYVSDEQRAAAGRETVAERMRALLPANRRRAEAAYAAGGLPDGLEAVRVWCPRDAAGLRERLGDSRYVLWAEDDVLHVLWRGAAEQVVLGGGIQVPLWPVEGTVPPGTTVSAGTISLCRREPLYRRRPARGCGRRRCGCGGSTRP